jgi:glycerol-3-phosphate dehydrogenase
MFDFRLVGEALRDRGRLLQRLASHLVRPVPFVYSLTHRGWERLYVGAGLTLYDALASVSSTASGVPRHKHLTKRQVLRLVASLRKDALVGAVEYYDAQVDDARHTMFLVRTAVAYGALAANRSRVTGFIRQGECVTGVRVRDLQTGQELDIRAKQVLNATGVWTDETQSMVGERGQFRVRASKGVHLVVPRDRIQSQSGLILGTPTSMLFVIPWVRHWIVSTTDTGWSLDKAHPAASSSDIDYILEHVNKALVTSLTREDVEGVYAGLRPLPAGESETASALSCEHVVGHPTPGLVVVAGGRYTTCRVMAADAVDEVARGLGGRIPALCTQRIPLLGAEGNDAAWNARQPTATRCGIHVASVEHLLRRYGSLAIEALDLCVADPVLAEALSGANDYLAAEVAHAASQEGARHLDDVLTRRTRISIETWDRGVSAAGAAAVLMATVLGWSDEQQAREVEHYLARVEAERASQQQPDDETADSARMGASEIVPLA